MKNHFSKHKIRPLLKTPEKDFQNGRQESSEAEKKVRLFSFLGLISTRDLMAMCVPLKMCLFR